MTPERLQRIEDIYHAASGRRSAAERQVFLAEACGPDEQLRQHVGALLAEDESDGILDRPVVAAQPQVPPVRAPPPGPGSQLGSYVLEKSIGIGGMGEVWKARDLRLGRDVAIKISAQEFTDRFDREARAIAALNHSNICTLYDVGADYLVMELVEGPTLAERIQRGRVPIDEALRIATQIAAAVEAAHDKEIIHRDLKPANIKIRPEGSVKVLDFGLAKSIGSVAGPDAQSATLTGVIVGSPNYMPPEQIRGGPVDKRADIWAFGVIVYEMVTGTRPFESRSVSDTLSAVLTLEPDWEPVPPKLQRLLRRCLEKDPARRMRNIAGVELLLEDLPALPARTSAMWIAVAALFVTSTAILSFVHFREKPPTGPVLRFAVGTPDKTNLALPNGTLSPVAVSPDGRHIVFSAKSHAGGTRLWIRSLDSLTARPLEGTENAVSPFWSPDSRFIGFGSDRKLNKIGLNGGPVTTLAGADYLGGGTWSKNNGIVFAPDWIGPIWHVSDVGGKAAQATVLNGSKTHRWPSFLPDGNHFLFSAPVTLWGEMGDHAAIYVGSVNSKATRKLFEADSNAIFAEGYLLFLRESTLMAQRFDVKGLAVTGDAFPIASRVQHNVASAAGLFSVSGNGVLVYSAGEQISRSLVWFDRSGRQLATLGEPGLPGVLHFSPDQKRVAVSIVDRDRSDIWIYDVVRNVRTRLTASPGFKQDAIWSPDGGTILFNSMHDGHLDLNLKASDGTGQEELVYSDGTSKYPDCWSQDGRFVFFEVDGVNTGLDLWVLPMAPGQPRKPYPWLQTEFNETMARFSPDGQWVAYQASDSGRLEIYVAPFSGPGGKQRISAYGGQYPRWRRDGKEVFYVGPDKMLMATEVSLQGPTVKIGKTQRLFGPLTLGLGALYDVSSDGQRFLASVPTESPGQELTVVHNWIADLTR